MTLDFTCSTLLQEARAAERRKQEEYTKQIQVVPLSVLNSYFFFSFGKFFPPKVGLDASDIYVIN